MVVEFGTRGAALDSSVTVSSEPSSVATTSMLLTPSSGIGPTQVQSSSSSAASESRVRSHSDASESVIFTSVSVAVEMFRTTTCQVTSSSGLVGWTATVFSMSIAPGTTPTSMSSRDLLTVTPTVIPSESVASSPTLSLVKVYPFGNSNMTVYSPASS